ncbi:iron-containing alcohol dehydrogenase family protein [Bacillus sp. NSP9.1]|uniref:iron-containing alcohol dehydrogenase family protein n=1 Tax=Bacillus sp. NSP9.1 TaxID=1071078 RepID=UPI00041AD033|nr:iron-containing alcohol dehydrogenase family protein [Bacillus sp. NSP9.1]QHZ48793.1 iron-containing alcohol dehydrogenase family protein [Bacillus sp. NSP9.1]
MQPEDIVRSGPNQYICKAGITKELPSLLERFNRPVIITGVQSFAAFTKHVQLPADWTVIQHKGYSSLEGIRRAAERAGTADIIIGIGGGTVLDTAKAAADLLHIEVMTIPTIPGTCAASTPLSVIYDDEGNFSGVQYHKRSSYLTLVDPLLLLSSPLAYVKSGIGDTLAKWYEAEAIIRNTADSLSIMVQTGLRQSVFIRDILLKDGLKAVESIEKGETSPALTNVLEAVIALAGTVGGYAGRYGRMAGAHAVHNGLTFIQETHHVLHGQKVAYGILVQLALEGRMDEIAELLPFYESLGFPRRLCDLGITENVEQAKQTIAAHAARPEESLSLMGSFREADVIAAIESLE